MRSRHRRWILGTTGLVLLASSLAWAGDLPGVVPEQGMESPSVPAHGLEVDPAAAVMRWPVYVPDLAPGLEVSGGLLVLKPGADNLGYATITTFLPIQNPQWAVQTLTPEYQCGFQVGTRYVLPCSGHDIQVNYQHLRTSDSASAPVSNPATQWVSPFSQTGPSTSEAANVVGVFHLKAAQGKVDFDYDEVNVDIGQSLNIGPNTRLRLFGGLSCVRLQEQLVSTFYNDPNIVPQPPVIAIPNPSLQYISLNNTSTYTGLGPRLGFSSSCNVPGGFSLVGQLSGALLVGWKQPAEYSFSGVYPDRVDSEKIASTTVSQVVYAGDAKIGARYSYTFASGASVRVESGFQAAIFIHPFSTYETSTNVLPLDIGSLSTNSMRHTPSNFTLNGFYATCGWHW